MVIKFKDYISKQSLKLTVVFFALVGIVFSETNVEEPSEMVEMEEEKSLNYDNIYATPMYADTYRKDIIYAPPQPAYDSYRNNFKHPTMAYRDSYRNDLKYAAPAYGDSYRNDLKYSSPVYGDKYGQDYKRDYADYDFNLGYGTYGANPYRVNYGIDKYDRYDPYTKKYNTYSVAY